LQRLPGQLRQPRRTLVHLRGAACFGLAGTLFGLVGALLLLVGNLFGLVGALLLLVGNLFGLVGAYFLLLAFLRQFLEGEEGPAVGVADHHFRPGQVEADAQARADVVVRVAHPARVAAPRR